MILIPQYRTARRASAGGGLLLTDLVAHWDLSEASGTTRLDSHTGGFDLADTGTVGTSTGVDGVSTCASFAASNRYLSVAHDAAFNPSDQHMMVNAWAYSVSGSANTPGIVCKGNPGSAGGEWGIRGGLTADDPHYFGCNSRNAGNSASVFPATAKSYSRSTWHMVSYYYDPGADLLYTYVDGVNAASAALAGGIYTGTSVIAVGSAGTASGRFYGRIQAVSVWIGAGAQTALSEIAWLYNSGSAARMYSDLQSYGG